MSFSVGSNFLMSNFVAPGTFSTTTATGGGVPTGQMYQMNDGKNQYFNASGTAWGNSTLFLADGGDVIHLSGGGWDAGVDSTTTVANGIGTVSGKLYTSGDKKVFVAGGAKVDTTDANAQGNKDALGVDLTTIQRTQGNMDAGGNPDDGLISASEVQRALDANKFSGTKKTFWETVLAKFSDIDKAGNGKTDDGLVSVEDLAKSNYVNQP